MFDFVVGQHGLGDRVPVDQSFAAVDQAVFEKIEEIGPHGLGARFVHGKAGAVPIAGAAHALELAEDAGFVFVLPGLDVADEFFAGKVGAAFALLGQKAFFHHGLGGDAGVVGARHPEGVEALHPPHANQDVLKRVVEGVT